MKPVTLAAIKADPEFKAECSRAFDQAMAALAEKRRADRAEFEAYLDRSKRERRRAQSFSFGASHQSQTNVLKTKATGRSPHMITFMGLTLSHSDWADRTGIPLRTIKSRLSYGWTIERTLTGKVQRKRKAGVGKNFSASKGTGGGRNAQHISELEISE